jgi:hypothetical protein
MKNQLLKLRKAEGFVSIETIMIAAIMVLAGIVAYNVLYAGTLAEKANAARGVLTAEISGAEEVIYRVLSPWLGWS